MQDFGKWLLGWIATSGFAGLSAVIAATIAFLASWRGRVADRVRFERSHWWQLAKWATDNLASDNKRRVDVGFLALNYLAQDPPGQQEEDYVYQLFDDFAGDFVLDSDPPREAGAGSGGAGDANAVNSGDADTTMRDDGGSERPAPKGQGLIGQVPVQRTVDITDKALSQSALPVDSDLHGTDNEGNVLTNEGEHGSPRHRGWFGGEWPS